MEAFIKCPYMCTCVTFADSMMLYENWPHQAILPAVEFYYQVELGAYLHQLMWTEVSRSDSLEMIVHHLTTILLIVFSYLTNFSRFGSVILLLHDLADVFLESAKVFNYTSKAPGHHFAKHLCDVLFATFAITFFITRLVLYPRYILYTVFFEAPGIFGINWPGYWVFAGLLSTLQCLHVFWFYLIFRMVYRLVTTGIEKDERSDDEDESDSVPITPATTSSSSASSPSTSAASSSSKAKVASGRKEKGATKASKSE